MSCVDWPRPTGPGPGSPADGLEETESPARKDFSETGEYRPVSSGRHGRWDMARCGGVWEGPGSTVAQADNFYVCLFQKFITEPGLYFSLALK